MLTIRVTVVVSLTGMVVVVVATEPGYVDCCTTVVCDPALVVSTEDEEVTGLVVVAITVVLGKISFVVVVSTKFVVKPSSGVVSFCGQN